MRPLKSKGNSAGEPGKKGSDQLSSLYTKTEKKSGGLYLPSIAY